MRRIGKITTKKRKVSRLRLVLVLTLIGIFVLLCLQMRRYRSGGAASSPALADEPAYVPPAPVIHDADAPDILTRKIRATPPLSRPRSYPNLALLMERIRKSIRPYMLHHLARVSVDPLIKDKPDAGCGGGWLSPLENAVFKGMSEISVRSLDEAKRKCVEEESSTCLGITEVPAVTGSGESSTYHLTTTAEVSYTQIGASSWGRYLDPCRPGAPGSDGKQVHASASNVWKAFHDAMDVALGMEEELHLNAPLGPTREDDSIFISIAAYRDTTCKATLRRAFERATYPERISVGIVQQNCVHPTACMTGTGWADTRRWVSRPGPDPDCVQEFCASPLGKTPCEEGRVRILRLDEIDALGPFFTRFLNWKLWRGENFYLQIDAHTDFRSGWDESLVAQMKATSTYPRSVISNYPPPGSPNDPNPWDSARNPVFPDSNHPPEALCACTFETAGSGAHYTVRLAQRARSVTWSLGTPRKSCFVAAGFFVAHGSIAEEVGFDPFLPFLFMGEELALSVRFFTFGYDIYAPTANVLKHEYVRQESSKFWESVGMVYRNGGIHNELTELIVSRVQYLSGFPEAREAEMMSPRTLITRMKEFGNGKVRDKDQFAAMMGLDYAKRRQIPPAWCLRGEMK